MLQGLIVLTRPNYDPKPYQHMLLFWAVMAFAVFINVLASTLLPKFEGFILVLHIVGYFAILLPLLILGEHQDPHQVFGLWLNLGKLPTQGTSFMVGLLGPVFMFLGADGAVHVGPSGHYWQSLIRWLITLCLDVRRNSERSEDSSLVDSIQHRPQWCLGSFDDDSDAVRHCRSTVLSELPDRLCLYGYIRPGNWFSCWSNDHGLYCYRPAAVCQRWLISGMFADVLVICARSRLAGLQDSREGQMMQQSNTNSGPCG